jgi:hypothetical protein
MSEPAPTNNSPPAAPLPFTEEEWRGFRKSDRGVTAVIASMLTGLFLLGLILYVWIALDM